jgi:hypothetical protein
MIDARKARELMDVKFEQRTKELENIIEQKVNGCLLAGKNMFSITSSEALLLPLDQLEEFLKKHHYTTIRVDDQKQGLSYIQVSF